mmetsp:Transcript_25869/g.59574  ORF Transcript_25869/g.59574 Transcript_25869/m.59574 type:complete len:231 (+) Transcript_25869:858-1550(+)
MLSFKHAISSLLHLSLPGPFHSFVGDAVLIIIMRILRQKKSVGPRVRSRGMIRPVPKRPIFEDARRTAAQDRSLAEDPVRGGRRLVPRPRLAVHEVGRLRPHYPAGGPKISAFGISSRFEFHVERVAKGAPRFVGFAVSVVGRGRRHLPSSSRRQYFGHVGHFEGKLGIAVTEGGLALNGVAVVEMLQRLFDLSGGGGHVVLSPPSKHLRQWPQDRVGIWTVMVTVVIRI